MDPPNCFCGKRSVLLRTKKPGVNYNRWFYVCPSRLCKFFKWVGKRSADTTSYDSRMQIKKIEGSGVIDAIRDRYTTVKFQIQSNTKITITVGENGYSLLSYIRQLPNAAFDETTLKWAIPATYQHYTHSYESLLRSPYYRSIHCTPLPDHVIQILKNDYQPCMEMAPFYLLDDNYTESECEKGADNVGEEGNLLLQTANLCAHVEETVYDYLKPYATWNHLMDYQQQGVRECLMKGGRVLLADEMGLGKTIQALAVALAYSDDWPVLIICPTSLLLSWSDQIQKWLPMVSNKDIRLTLKGNDLFGYTPAQVVPIFEDYTGNISTNYNKSNFTDRIEQQIQSNGKGGRCNQAFDSAYFYIISYEIAASHGDDLARMEFKLIICDESHSLKNPKTKRTKALTPLLHKSKHVLLLTGTPILSRPIELFPQLYILRQDLFPDMNKYGVRYCSGRLMKYGWDFTGASNLSELNFILEKSVMIRRLKEDIHLQLPSKIRQKAMMAIGEDHKSRLANLKERIAKMKGQPKLDMVRNAMSMEMYKVTGTAKIPSIISYLQPLLASTDEKIILFAYHKDVMDAIENAMKNERIGYIRIDGTTKQTERHMHCLRFQSLEQEDPPIRMAILSITASNAGLNFQNATTVVFAELYWNPAQILQAEDRAHRIGQVNTVNVYYLMSEDTADDWLWELLGAKLQIMQKSLDQGALGERRLAD